MAAEDFDGYAYMDVLMKKEGTTQDEIQEAYHIWAKTYDKVGSWYNSGTYNFCN